jgi:hypothetical protein
MAVAPLPISVFRLLQCSTEEVSSENAAADRKTPTTGPLVRRAVCVDVPLNPVIAGTAGEGL